MTPKVVERKGTQLLHGDDAFRRSEDVAPPLSVSTTFLSRRPDDVEVATDYRNPSRHVYSRYTTPNSTRAEHILSQITDGFALTYSSGLAASYAALVFYKPKRIAMTEGYHGCHAMIQVYLKAAPEVKIIKLDDDFESGDLCWLETPLNPTGESRSIQHYANKVHKVGGKIIVDSTFAPPPLQYPFKFGTDCILHSATKYFGGHSDLLGGVLVVRTKEEWDTLQSDRTYMGNSMGSMESWLLLRSLRTFHLRLPRQSETASALVEWLQKIVLTPEGQAFDGVPGGILTQVWHSSLQAKDARGFDPSTQMTGGWNATFSIELSKAQYAAWFPHSLEYFTPATSLGGVESLAEYRYSWDPTSNPRAVRISIGVEDLDDLKADIRQALRHLVQTRSKL
ncbi:Cys/Met metabolism PLP-dependent enzyme-domain-containing protein [Mycena alexandri]|uniref:Cys/Met metabolism PLP-dependent enzyme-domain-containing protein n=1 Tax=Mycena alexandri TaxID=1745969 RepID=A0AAD6XEW4_9AGAR|nr:Cys/Met metabolism PLP-dependent enzyme-domain-containing protein [Mycena alexandri]